MREDAKEWWEEPVPPAWSGTETAWPDESGAGPYGGGIPGGFGEPSEPPAPPERPDVPPRDDDEAHEIRDHVAEVLKNVVDPELGINIVDLGLVYGIDVYDDRVYITYTLTTMGCPIGPMIEMEMQRFLADVPGIERVDAEMVFRPPWTPEMMSEEAKAALGFF
jgi:metal-sulfur cluster biosynthetic enzyme